MAQDTSPFDEDAAGSRSDGSLKDADMKQLREAWPEIEALVESAGRRDKLNEDVAQYIQALREEEKANAKARKFAVIGIASFLVFGWGVIYCLIVIKWGYFYLIGSNARVAIVAGWSVMTGLFIVSLLRGIYRISSERHLNGLPENLRAVFEMTKD